MELIQEIGAYAGLVAFLGLALLALLSFTQGRDLRRLREWAGSAPERDSERKEATAAVASHKAEEMRKLEEARQAEREAAEQREERRKRREEGLPELTASERLRERFGGGTLNGGGGSRFGRPAYLVAIAAAAVLLVGGVAFAVLGGSDDGGGGKAKGNGGGAGGNAAAQVRPSEIEVTVLNGTATPGLAATYGDMVEGKGFQLGAVTNSTSGFEDSIVMFEPGNKPEARRVSGALDIPRVRPMTSEIAAVSAGAPVSVVIGEDNASTAG